jgi:hypothetical protein
MKVKELGHKGTTTLVEWDDGMLHRGYIPSDQIEDGEVSSDTLSAAIPYGVQLDLPCVTPEQIEDMLHRAGLWTVADIRKHPMEVKAVLDAVYKVSWSAFQKTVFGG